MKKVISLLLSVLMLIASLTACGGSESGSPPSRAGSETSGTPVADSISSEEKPPLVIYRTSDDEIEMHFTSESLKTVEDVIFLAPDGNGTQNPAVILTLEQYDGAIHPLLRVYTDASYKIDEYNGEMEYSIENDTLICHIQHENIAPVFHKVTLWHIGDAKPVSFEGVMTDDLTGAFYKPMEKGVLPAEFKRSEYDEQYFTPDSDDFIILSYDISVNIYEPTWFTSSLGVYLFGPYRDENQHESSVKVTSILSFDGDTPISTKIRAEYQSAEDAKLASLVYDFRICPSDLGYPNKPNDELVTEDYYLQADQMLYEKLKEQTTSTLTATYCGLVDQFRYFEFDRQEDRLEYLDFVPLSDNTSSLQYLPFLSLSYQAGETVTQSVTNHNKNYTLTIYSAKKTYEAGSDSSVLDAMYQLSGDAVYFSPSTEDYAYVIKLDSTYDYGNGISDYNQIVNLYSFDEQGNLVQCICRMYDSYFLQDSFIYKDYFPDYSEEDWNHVIYDENEKVFYIDDFTMDKWEPIEIYEGLTAKQSLQTALTQKGQHEGYYFSEP